ncbi:hypothetical protein P4123_00565 [Pseudomonas aeruginosa]|nr:hypothetical protein [Pseudomonas aeruginosa]
MPCRLALACGSARNPLAVEERQHQQTLGADRRLGGQPGEFVEIEVQQVLYQAAGAGEVHRAGQRQPAAGRGAEGRQLAVRTDQRPLGIGGQGAGGAQAGGEQAGADVAGADGGEHVVAVAAGHPVWGARPRAAAASGRRLPMPGAGLDQLRQRCR